MTDELVKFSFSNGVVYAEFDNYRRRNALSVPLMKQLAEGAQGYLERERATVIVVSGSGGVFSSGVDVTTVPSRVDGDIVENYLDNREFGRHTRDFGALPMVKIAKIEGYCFGAGVNLATYCDVRFAADDTVFQLPELDLGSPFGAQGFDRLRYFLGPSKALDLVLTARRFSAEEAATTSFLTGTSPKAELADRVKEYAEQLAARPPFLLMQSVLVGQTSMAAALRPPSTEFDAAMLAPFDERSRAQNHLFAARFSGRGES